MKWRIDAPILIVLLLVLFGLRAGQALATVDERFRALEFNGEGDRTLLYRLLEPADYDPDGAGQHPLVIFLHGAGERGNDNRKQLVHGSEMMLTMAEKHGAFVLVPQCPAGEKWVDVEWSAPTHKMPEQPSPSMALVMQLLEKLRKDYRVDLDRIYVMGLSMGGYGTWDALQRYPDTFAAGVPICGGGDDSRAGQIKAAVWCFHGDSDRAVPPARSRNMVEAMRKAGGNVKFTEYPNVGHNSWSRAFADPALLEWLFARKRGGQ